MYWAHPGRFSMGKNVPLKRNMGVMNRNTGRLNSSMLATIAVKIIPMEPKAMPPIRESGIIRRPSG